MGVVDVVPTGTLDLGGGGGGGAVGRGGGGGVVFVNEDAPPEVDGRVPVDAEGRVPVDVEGRVPVDFVKEDVPDGAEGLVVLGLDVPDDVPLAFLAAALDATVRVGIPSEILLHPANASDATVSAVGRFSGERYLQPANARAPMLVSFPST